MKTSELRELAGSVYVSGRVQDLAAEVIRLREALAGAANVLDLLRTYGKAKYDCASSRAGTFVHVAPTIDAARALLTEHDDE